MQIIERFANIDLINLCIYLNVFNVRIRYADGDDSTRIVIAKVEALAGSSAIHSEE